MTEPYFDNDGNVINQYCRHCDFKLDPFFKPATVCPKCQKSSGLEFLPVEKHLNKADLFQNINQKVK